MSDVPPAGPEKTTQVDRAPSSHEGAWASPVGRIRMGGAPAGAVNLNVEGRKLTSPLKGFGQLWQKTYKVRLSGVTVSPEQVIRVWKQEFPSFWPKGNHFYPSLTGIQPGEVALLNLAGPAGLPLISTGIVVIYADDQSFSFMTPQGHMFAAMITFSADEDQGVSVVQVQALVRASDPLYEMTFRLGFGHRTEDDFWRQTLENLARHFGIQGQVQQQVTCLDEHVQWSEAKNIWHNAAVRTGLHMPVALAKKIILRRR